MEVEVLQDLAQTWSVIRKWPSAVPWGILLAVLRIYGQHFRSLVVTLHDKSLD